MPRSSPRAKLRKRGSGSPRKKKSPTKKRHSSSGRRRSVVTRGYHHRSLSRSPRRYRATEGEDILRKSFPAASVEEIRKQVKKAKGHIGHAKRELRKKYPAPLQESHSDSVEFEVVFLQSGPASTLSTELANAFNDHNIVVNEWNNSLRINEDSNNLSVHTEKLPNFANTNLKVQNIEVTRGKVLYREDASQIHARMKWTPTK
jgi:hypothetical protein